ncbi:hypothetical protein L1987_38581 [Smallanthus sonchifolius]|uniref:Uncharacterized protein n=1 Tax=Smallanthus sonchifolius TaxID=185202 RepID=A0ACB9HLE1_9ASTR|nr:hypothetical protein L1987_38581 [Smallanthus sonchifolius]
MGLKCYFPPTTNHLQPLPRTLELHINPPLPPTTNHRLRSVKRSEMLFPPPPLYFDVDNGGASEKSMPPEPSQPPVVENSKELSSPAAADPLENSVASCLPNGEGEVVSAGKVEAAPAASVVTPIAQGKDSAAEIGATSKINPLGSSLEPSINETGNTLETRERNRDSQPASAPGMPARSVMLKEEILAGIIDGHEVDVSFGEFLYYLRQMFLTIANEIRLDSTGAQDLDKLLISTLFEVVSSESRNIPFILFLKDAEKSIVGSSESYSTFKDWLEKLPDNVVVIGSQTHTDSRKEKSHPGGGLLFTKFGSNQTALLDFNLPDIGRLHERGKEVPKATKLLTRLFPNKVTIHMPQDENLLASWKQHLDRDAETLKMNGNLNNLRNVLNRTGLECDGLETLCIKDQLLTNEGIYFPESFKWIVIKILLFTGAEKIVGWALSHHLMQHAKADPDARLVLSNESIQYGVEILQAIQNESKSLKKSLKDIVTENEFEKRLLADVIPPSDIGVTFNDIGALEKIQHLDTR